jgi:hypothetical protein
MNPARLKTGAGDQPLATVKSPDDGDSASAYMRGLVFLQPTQEKFASKPKRWLAPLDLSLVAA